MILGCYVGPANENDREGVKFALKNMVKKYSNVKKMWADMGYVGKDLKTAFCKEFGIDLEIVKRASRRFWVHKDISIEELPQVESGFKIQPRRWVVERTFGWLG